MQQRQHAAEMVCAIWRQGSLVRTFHICGSHLSSETAHRRYRKQIRALRAAGFDVTWAATPVDPSSYFQTARAAALVRRDRTI